MTTVRSEQASDARIRRYVAVLGVLGAAAIVANLATATGLPAPVTFLVIVVLAALGDVEFLAIRHGEESNAFNCSEAILAASLVFLGPWTPLAGTVGVLAHQVVSGRAPLKLRFNTTAYAVSASASAAVHFAVLSQGAPQLAALAAAAVVYYAVNLATVARVISLATGRSWTGIVTESGALSAGVSIGNSTVAIMIALTARVEPLILVTVPLLLIQLIVSYRNARAMASERDVWVRLQEVSSKLVRSGSDDVAPVVLDALADLLNAHSTELTLLTPDGAHSWVRDAGGHTTESSGSVEDLIGADWELVQENPSAQDVVRSEAKGLRGSLITQPGISRVMVAPLEIGGELVGMIRANCDGLANMGDRATSVLTNLASQTSAALASERLIDELRHAADHDSLTGLPNRTRLLVDLERALENGRAVDEQVSLLFFDLDRFKVINDSLGHHAGDEVLVAVAERIRSVVREQDLVARFGGDEFIVVCSASSVEPAIALAHRVVESLSEPLEISGRRTTMSVCIGIAPDDGNGEASSLLRDADAAMYAAKADGAGSVRVFNRDMRTAVMRRLELDSELRKALDADEIDVAFQPIVDLGTGSTVELEALARWNHPQLGPIAPADFIAAAEESGQIRRLGATVLDKACRRLKQWQDMGLGGPGLRVAVNISALQVDDVLPSVVADTLRRTGLAAHCLSLEVTESALVAGSDAVRVLTALRRTGVSIALDDFGTGFSSLSALHDLPVATLKIDQSFVRSMGNHRDDAMVRGIIGLADALGIQVVAEGIETAEDAARLRSFGCGRGQGWHFGRPVASPLIDTHAGTAEVVPIRSRRESA